MFLLRIRRGFPSLRTKQAKAVLCAVISESAAVNGVAFGLNDFTKGESESNFKECWLNYRRHNVMYVTYGEN